MTFSMQHVCSLVQLLHQFSLTQKRTASVSRIRQAKILLHIQPASSAEYSNMECIECSNVMSCSACASELRACMQNADH